MSQGREVEPNKDVQEDNNRRTDVGDIVSIICIIFCLINAARDAICYWVLDDARVLAEAYGVSEGDVVVAAFSFVYIWFYGIALCEAVREQKGWTAGARAVAAIACVCATICVIWFCDRVAVSALAERENFSGVVVVMLFVVLGVGGLLCIPLLSVSGKRDNH